MPENRPRSNRLNASPRGQTRAAKSKTPAAKTRRGKNNSFLTWTAVGLTVLLVALIVLYCKIPDLKAWMGHDKSESLDSIKPVSTPVEPLEQHPIPAEIPPTNTPAPLMAAVVPAPSIEPATIPAVVPVPVKPVPPPVVPKPVVPPVENKVAKTLKERANEETKHLVERTILVAVETPEPKPVAPVTENSPPSGATSPSTNSVTGATEPPVAQPATGGKVSGAPRALPVDTGKLDAARIAGYQVALERIHFSCGFIDGDQGMRTQRMLRAFQTSRGLPVTGVLDPATRDAIGEPSEPFFTYTVTQDDVSSIMPKPASWKEKSQAKRLGYNNIWELLAEKFHCTRAYLKGLNKEVSEPIAGTEIVGPKISPAVPLPKAASIRINLSETTMEALDSQGKIIAFFPCSIAKDKAKRPSGLLTVKTVDPDPDYTFDPALFVDSAKAEGITKKMMIPPGPRNPVGTDWVGLSLPGYGIHGTPEPENISRTQSHGCFRLANWNAEKVLKMVKVGTPVDVEP